MITNESYRMKNQKTKSFYALSSKKTQEIFVWFWNQGNGGVTECLWECSFFFSLLEKFLRRTSIKCFVCLVEFFCEVLWSWTFVGSGFITYSISFLVTLLFNLFLLKFLWVVCFQEVVHFFQIVKFVHSVCLWFLYFCSIR